MIASLTAYVALGFLAFLGAAVIWLIWTGKINLARLISEPNGDASMSRFQLLIFTFIIAASLFLVVAGNQDGPAFPAEIPQGVLLLLGISSSSYLVSKGIQFSAPEGVEDRPPEVTVSPGTVQAKVGGPSVQFKARVDRSTNEAVEWTIDDPKMGDVDKTTGVYTPPSAAPAGVSLPATVVVTATSVADNRVSDTGTVALSA
jgi:hypothetical protein